MRRFASTGRRRVSFAAFESFAESFASFASFAAFAAPPRTSRLSRTPSDARSTFAFTARTVVVSSPPRVLPSGSDRSARRSARRSDRSDRSTGRRRLRTLRRRRSPIAATAFGSSSSSSSSSSGSSGSSPAPDGAASASTRRSTASRRSAPETSAASRTAFGTDPSRSTISLALTRLGASPRTPPPTDNAPSRAAPSFAASSKKSPTSVVSRHEISARPRVAPSAASSALRIFSRYEKHVSSPLAHISPSQRLTPPSSSASAPARIAPGSFSRKDAETAYNPGAASTPSPAQRYTSYRPTHPGFASVSAGFRASLFATPPRPLSHQSTSHRLGPLYRKERVRESNSSGRPMCAWSKGAPRGEMVALASATIRASAALFAAPAYATACWMSGWVRKCAARERARGAPAARSASSSADRAEETDPGCAPRTRTLANPPAWFASQSASASARTAASSPARYATSGKYPGGGAPGRDDAPRRARSRPSAARASSRAPVASASATSAVAEATPATAARSRPRSLEPEADPREATTTLGSTASRGGGRRSGRARGMFGTRSGAKPPGCWKNRARATRASAPRAGAGRRATRTQAQPLRVSSRAGRHGEASRSPAPRARCRNGARAERAGAVTLTTNLPQKTRGGSSGRGRAGRTITQCPKVETG